MIIIAKRMTKSYPKKVIGKLQSNLPPTRKNKTILRSKLFMKYPNMDYFVLLEKDSDDIVYNNQHTPRKY